MGGQICGKFGVHQSLSFVTQLYNDDEPRAAFIANVGNLVEPVSRNDWHRKHRCISLFSHADQQMGAQTATCQENQRDRGVGGRIADALTLGAMSYAVESWSMSGAGIFPRGVKVELAGAKPERFEEYGKWHDALVNITTQQHRNPYANAYTLALADSIKITEYLSNFRKEETLVGSYANCGGLCNQLREVSRVIGGRAGRRVERDVFFVSTGGWDMHNNLKMNMNRGLGHINDGVSSFVDQMKAQGIWKDVVLFSSSEFSRTLDSNGGGSDHGYGANHFIIGGSVRGGRIFNKYMDELRNGGRADLGRGRLIPDYPWESVLVPIAEWMGVDRTHLDQVFPNLRNFNSSRFIIPTEMLFEMPGPPPE